MSDTRFVIRKSKDARFYWVQISNGNNETLATSEMYERMQSALEGAQAAGSEGTVQYEGGEQ